MLLFRGWRYRLKELYFTDKTITEAINNRPLEVQKDHWDWLVNHWADPKQQVTIVFVTRTLTTSFYKLSYTGVYLIMNIYRISEKNQINRLKQTIKPSNGAKSTARIYHDKVS